MNRKKPPTHDRLELRSKKVRNLLEEIPSPIVRYGTLFIIAIFLIGVIIATCIPYSDNESASILEYMISGIKL